MIIELIGKAETRLVKEPGTASGFLKTLILVIEFGHSALTHAARGRHPPTLLTRFWHASVRSLERYAQPGVASRDPLRRGNRGRE
ncbi:hypothetical protein [Nonomuraea sp. KM88]|uniref:hypothetical protein n=1 Tax=Nonomuraea sp. KM88 TaxID=3457427 RepID=UPI003FCECA43